MKAIVVFVATFVAMTYAKTTLDEFTYGNNELTARLYQEILKTNPEKSFVFSPISLEIIFALARAGAKGDTEKELTTGLNLPNQPKTEEFLRNFLPALQRNEEDIQLLSANKIYLANDLKILESFKQTAVEVFKAGIENVNFGEAESTRKTINQWVEQQTNNRIQNLIEEGKLDANTRMVLVNTLYFLGEWENVFTSLYTKPETFYVSSTETIEVDMMQNLETYKYCECNKTNAKYLELPYFANNLQGNLAMTIVLPNEKGGLASLETNMKEVLEPKDLEYTDVRLSLPKFKVETSLPLIPMLQNLGVRAVFTGAADLSGISKEPLSISEAVQKVFIKVTEKGTEAAAATYGEGTRIAKFERAKFNADHPFTFFIKYNGVVLFAGRYVG